MKFIEVINSAGNTNLINIDHIVRIYPAGNQEQGNAVLVLASLDAEGKNDILETTIPFEDVKKRLGGFVIDPKPTGKTVGFR